MFGISNISAFLAIVDRDEDFIIVQSIIKTPQRIIAELETDQQANLSKCVSYDFVLSYLPSSYSGVV